MSKSQKDEALNSVSKILSESEESRLQQNSAVTERHTQAGPEGIPLPELPTASAPYGYDVNGEPRKRPQRPDIERAALQGGARLDPSSRCQAHGIPDCSVCAALKKSVALARLSARNLPVAVVGVEYCQAIRFVSEVPIKPPYSWTMTSGSSLPDGLKLGDDDMIRGVPTTEGITHFTAIAEDSSDPPQYLLQRFCLRVTVPQQAIVPAPVSAPADVQPIVLPTLTEAEARKALGIKEPLPEPRFMLAWRTFYHVPRKPDQVQKWGPDLDGLTPVNIAAFLMMPEVLYRDYENNKHNPPKTIFRTAAVSYDTTSYKARGANWVMTERRIKGEGGSEAVGADDIVMTPESLEAYYSVHTDPIPPERVMRKLPVPPQMLEALANAKAERNRLKKSEQKKLPPEQRYDDSDTLRVEQRKFDRKIKDLEAQIGSWSEWGRVDVPGTGLPSFKIVLPFCPEGSECMFPVGLVKQYLKIAWAETYGSGSQRRKPVPLSNQKISWWDFKWIDFENKVINRAARLGMFVFAYKATKGEQALVVMSGLSFAALHEQALEEDARRQDDDDITDLRARWLADNEARENAARNYRGEEGRALDPAIRRAKPQGHGPKSDEYDHWQ
jgi:hypothetical protein